MCDNPYEDSQHAVWQDPTEYDMQKHGPPYLPVKLASDQKAEVRSWLEKQAAYYDTGPAVVPSDGSPYDLLCYLLAGLRTMNMLHQTAHWQTRGGHFYGDHELFGRLYEESLPAIDGVAERLIGLSGDPAKVSLCEQAPLIAQMVMVVHQGDPDPAPDPEKLVKLSLWAETTFIGALTMGKKMLDEAGALTEGLDDLLQGIASTHETFVYLLKQRAGAGAGESYTYDRR
jgi:DNA-binding ferritin-like protein